MSNLPDDFDYGHEAAMDDAIGQAYDDAKTGRTAYRLAHEWEAEAERLRDVAGHERIKDTDYGLSLHTRADIYAAHAREIERLGDLLSDAV